MAIVVVQAKSMQKLYFLASKPILKKFPKLFLSPNPSPAKNQVKMVPEQLFTGPRPYSMSISEAPSCRVKNVIFWLNPFKQSGKVLSLTDWTDNTEDGEIGEEDFLAASLKELDTQTKCDDEFVRRNC